MVYAFNANEMLDLAIRIEENGGRFYRKAAQLQSDPEKQALLDQLAVEHRQILVDNGYLSP